MTVRMHSNPTGLIARQNFSGNLFTLSDSVRRLSSGLRVSSTADDPVSTTIASQLSTQALGLGQAVKNANDGIAAMQVVDASLSEAMDILGLVRNKAQSASLSGQSSATHTSLHNDIVKLLNELDQLIGATSFHDSPLLTGGFTNKAFQIGHSAGEAVSASFPSLKTTHIGQVRAGELTLTGVRGGQVNLRFDNQGNDSTIVVNSVALSFSNEREHGMGGVADAINAYSETTGIKAYARVSVQSESAITAGSTTYQFAINGIRVGTVSVADGDSDDRLANAINAKTSSHGVNAEVSAAGILTLSSTDGRPIEVAGSGGLLGFTDSAMTTFGLTQILQYGPYNLNHTDSSVGLAVAFSSSMQVSAPVITSIDSTLAPDSVLGGSSTLAAGWLAGQDVLGVDLNGNVTTTEESILKAGSVLASGSILAASSVLGEALTVAGAVTTSTATVLRAGSVLASDSVIAKDSYLTNAIVTTGGPLAAGQVIVAPVILADDLVVARDMLLQNGSEIGTGSQLANTSQIGGEVTLVAPMTLSKTMTLAGGSTIRDLDGVTVVTAGSKIGGETQFAGSDLPVTSALLVKAGSTLAVSSELALGSTIGGEATLAGSHTASDSLYLAAGSIIAAGSTIKSGTTLTNDLVTTTGLYLSGVSLSQDVETSGSNSVSHAMTLPQGTVLAGGSVLAASITNETGVELAQESSLRLHDISLMTSQQATIALVVVDAAMADLERIKKQAAAVSGQLAGFATVQGGSRNIMDLAKAQALQVDFTEEAENFTKMQMLVRTSSFAVTQANAVPSNVLSIMQGGSERQASQFFIAALNRILTSGAVV